MHLMMRGADEDAPEHAAERNPHVRMLDVGVNEQHQDDVRIRQLIGGLAEYVVAQTVGDRGRDRENVGEDPGADRMHAEIREGGVSTLALWCTLWNSPSSGTLWLSQ